MSVLDWTVKLTPEAETDLARLDKSIAKRIRNSLLMIEKLQNPRLKGKALTGPLGEFWSYRVGDYRIICRIQDKQITVLVVKIAHRSNVYRKKH